MSKLKQNLAYRRLQGRLTRLRKMNQKLKQELVIDELTGLFNSRHLRQKLDAELRNRRDQGEQPALLFVDIDRFKSVNELHGHRAASSLLKQVGAVIRSLIREGDVAFRFGGDEFVILVSGGHEGAQSAGERIRQNIESFKFQVDGLKGLADVRLTVSVGLHVIRPDDTAATILDRADAALFEAKRLNRNKVVCSSS